MTLVPGARLGPYEIISTLGVGGMGEVYKARDVRLNRAVAIKVLPTDKLTDPERKRRFVQEARAASALNHPNIVTIYDVGSENGVEFLAMEFVDGKTLEDLTPRDGFRLPELLRYAVQIADALAKAHAAGIVHRDLKPGNAMVTGDGLVKVLDFGLAKLAPATGDEGATHMGGGTATAAPGSEAGLIVGTASFMSPEQAEGRPVDARSDVFSFGAMLYEMATGQRAFRGETAMSTISAILRDEPTPLSTLRADIPPEVDRVIRRCLRKDPNRRFQTFADLKVALLELKEESDSGTLMRAPRHSTPASGVAPRMVAIALGSAVIAAAAVIGWIALRPAEAPPPPMQRPVPLTTYRGDETDPSFSPDGGQLVFSWDGDRQDNYDLYVKVVGPSAPLRLTTNPDRDFSPRWSPDGRTIAFVRQTADANEVRVIPALGGSERVLVRFARGRIVRMLDWSLDGKWLVAGGRLPNERIVRLHAVSIESGEARPLTDPPPETDGDVEPAVAPDGKSIAFARATGMNLSEIRVLNVSPAFEAQGTPRLLETVGTYTREPAWTADGRSILYTAGIDLRSNFYRMRLDGSSPPQLLEALGDAVEQPTLSRAGQRLAFSRPLRRTGIWRLDLHEPVRAPEPLIVSTFRDAFPQYSPDGSRIAFYSNRSGLNQIWAADADGGGAAQLTSMTGNITGSPRWSPDGKQISFDSNTGGDWQIYVMNADGGRPTALTKDRLNNFVTSWSRDGQWIYFSRGNAPETIWKVKPNGESPTDLGHAGSAVVESPDGKTLYFTKSLGGNRTSLWRMPLGGGDEVQVVAEMYRYNFVVTAKGIYYDTPSTPDKPSSIEFLDVATGKVTTIHTLNRPVDLGFAVSPDGRYLLFAQSDQSGGDLLLVEQFN